MRRIVIGFIVAAACSSAPEDDYPGSYANAICAVIAPCCMANGFTFNKSNCVLGGAGFIKGGVDAAKKAGATFDRAAASQCVEAMKTLTASCSSDPLASAVCTRVWTGPKKAGESCTSDLECTHGPSGRPVCSGGFCTELISPAKLGDVCGVASGPPPASLADCGPSGLQCGFGSRVCEALTPIGSKCPGFTVCVKGAYCDATGTCAAQFATGTSCTKDAECTSGGCFSGKCAQNSVGSSKPCTGS